MTGGFSSGMDETRRIDEPKIWKQGTLTYTTFGLIVFGVF